MFSCCRRLIVLFGLLLTCYDILFFFCRYYLIIVFNLSLACYDVGVFHHFVTTLYFYKDNLNSQSELDQSNISNYSRQYIKELEL